MTMRRETMRWASMRGQGVGFGRGCQRGVRFSARVISNRSSAAAPASGTVTIDTFGSTFDTLLGAYTGNQLSSLRLIASNGTTVSAIDDDSGIGVQVVARDLNGDGDTDVLAAAQAASAGDDDLRRAEFRPRRLGQFAPEQFRLAQVRAGRQGFDGGGDRP